VDVTEDVFCDGEKISSSRIRKELLEGNMEGFGAYLDSLRTETVPGDAIWIDANDFSYQTDGDIYEILDGFFQV
jgi:hypothetical protein